MLKMLAIVLMIILLFRSVGFFLRLLLGRPVSNRSGNPFQDTRRRKTRDGNLHVDHAPRTKKNKSDFKGGEYVDYEDVS
jgi:hypothetical protein